MIVIVLLTLSVISAEDTTKTNKITKKSVEKPVTVTKTADKNIKTINKEKSINKNIKTNTKANINKNTTKTSQKDLKTANTKNNKDSTKSKEKIIKIDNKTTQESNSSKSLNNLLKKNTQKETKSDEPQDGDIITREEESVMDFYNTLQGLPHLMSDGGVGFCVNLSVTLYDGTKFTSEKEYEILNHLSGEDVQQYIKVFLIQNFNKGYFKDDSGKLQSVIWAFTDKEIGSPTPFPKSQGLWEVSYTSGSTTYLRYNSSASYNQTELRKAYDKAIADADTYEPIGHQYIETVDGTKYVYEFNLLTPTTSGQTLITVNYYELKDFDLKVIKHWDDHDDVDKLRPENINLSLYRKVKITYDGDVVYENDYRVDKIQLNKSDNWKGHYHLAAPDINNVKKVPYGGLYSRTYTYDYSYYLVEDPIANYTTENVKNYFTFTKNHANVTILNTHEVSNKTEVTVKKKWSDYHNHPSLRPSEIKVTLYADDDEIHTYHLKDENDWKLTISNLERFNDDGNEIKYKFIEKVPEHYTVSYTHEGNHYTILNTLISEINITGTKTWIDGNKHHNNAEEVRLTLKRTVVNKTTRVDETPTWHGNTYKYTNLPKYNHKGEEYIYNVIEKRVPGYDNPLYDGYDITNLKTAKYINITVTKKWVNNHEKIPQNITVNLLCNHEVIESVILSKENDWKHTFINLQQHDSNYNVLEYIVDEIIIPEGYHADYSGDMFNGFVITNSYKSNEPKNETTIKKEPKNETVKKEPAKETVNIKVRKIWITHGHKKPSSITVDLMIGEHHIETARLSSKNNWKYTFKNLDKYDENGELIEYTIDEVIIEEYYHVKYTGNMHDGFVITNEYKHVEPKVQTVNVTVTKKWKNNIISVNDSISVSLLANGQHVASTTLSHENNWIHTFTLLPKYDKKGKVIKYEVSEVIVPENFIAHYSGNMNKGLVITNIYINPVNKTLEEDKNITVHKKNKTEHKENITFENETELIHFKWGWELINMSKYFELYGDDNVTGDFADNNQTNNNYPETNPNNKATINNNNNQNSNSIGTKSVNSANSPNYEYNRYYNNYRRYNNNYRRYNNNYYRSYRPGNYYPSYNYADNGKGYKYHLYIYLYEEYILGHMSYQDFLAALEHEGIDIIHHHTHWDENGVLVVDYETLDDVPHTINLKDSQGHIEDSNAKIDKSGANSKDHIIDSGEVTSKHTEKSKQKVAANKQNKKPTSQSTNTKKPSKTSKKSSNSNTKSSNSNNKVSSTK